MQLALLCQGADDHASHGPTDQSQHRPSSPAEYVPLALIHSRPVIIFLCAPLIRRLLASCARRDGRLQVTLCLTRQVRRRGVVLCRRLARNDADASLATRARPRLCLEPAGKRLHIGPGCPVTRFLSAAASTRRRSVDELELNRLVIVGGGGQPILRPGGSRRERDGPRSCPSSISLPRAQSIPSETNVARALPLARCLASVDHLCLRGRRGRAEEGSRDAIAGNPVAPRPHRVSAFSARLRISRIGCSSRRSSKLVDKASWSERRRRCRRQQRRVGRRVVGRLVARIRLRVGTVRGLLSRSHLVARLVSDAVPLSEPFRRLPP